MSWRWIDRRSLLLLHGESVAEHGGGDGIRDEGLLDSALAHPQNQLAYGAPDLADLAASYCVGLAKNHPFVDGNKRVAFLSIGLFLALNGYRLQATQVEATQTILAVAGSDMSEAELAQWIREHAVKQKKGRP
jgi:death-on-curing protein